ncbi:MAG: glycosyl transferase [Firmicutes bacterium]|nr:glycosyl transferase [Bacillota bacterium]
MKVLQINSVCGIGSTGRIATDIASMLKENHIDSYIAYGRETSLEDDHVLKIGSKLDCYMHAVLTRMFDNHALQGSERATRNFINQINRLAPDIIHLHNLHGYYINIKILFDYLKKSGKPVVWTLHDCWSFTGHCAHFSYAQCEQWREGCNTCSQTRNYPASAFRDNSQSNYAKKRVIFSGLDNLTLVTPSKWLAGLAEKSFLARYPVKVWKINLSF